VLIYIHKEQGLGDVEVRILTAVKAGGKRVTRGFPRQEHYPTPPTWRRFQRPTCGSAA
jgi:hypothetical protein